MTLYLSTDGPLHRVHPLTKLTLLLVVLAAALLVPGYWLPIALFLVVLLLAVWGGVGRVWLGRNGRVLLPLIIMLFVIHGFFNPNGQTPLFTVWRFTLTREGVAYAFLLSSRLAAIVGVALLLLLTTHPGDLLTALTQRGLSPALAYIISSTLYILPQMQAKAKAIMQAQQARGLETEGALWRRARALLPLLAPLVLGALVDSEERAIALEARAFRVRGPKSVLHILPDSPGQRGLRMGLWLSVVLLIGWRLWRLFASLS
ncbi:MAG: energy-coupling factor transporter transmembrane protein EcfT [Ardenticatenaceae bacterium]|nr:energy-coupling factor transporter transmembrane protein EcfT [Ardenticatenaceae bacterium]